MKKVFTIQGWTPFDLLSISKDKIKVTIIEYK